jgi:hypothetical protein
MEENTFRPPGLVLTDVDGRTKGGRRVSFVRTSNTNQQSFKPGNAKLSGRKVKISFWRR